MFAFQQKWHFVAFAGVTLVGWAVLGFVSPVLFGIALGVAMFAGGIIGVRHVNRRRKEARRPVGVATLLKSDPNADRTREEVEETGDLIDQMLREGRYALLLRPQIVANLQNDQIQRALSELDSRMALVPDGDVLLRATRIDAPTDEREAPLGERIVRVEPMFLDRYPVTNRQYRAFVKAGGYEQISLWDPTVWPAILDFVDSTGHPGPRFWKDGHFASGEADHPVVGVSWYEASAYARWVGKRLPSDPEWVKAGGWPVQVPGGKPLQRKHPWGDTMDRMQANLWGSGPGKTVAVHELNNGGTVGGVYQLIGNVWEWTTSNFGAWDPAMKRVEAPTQMKSIRGGAFDTYFDNQANCQFQSGDSPMSRKHNIGFRCALSMCDLGSFDGNEKADEEREDSEADTRVEEVAI
jgi:iron(II)-dependent oxidoreductase